MSWDLLIATHDRAPTGLVDELLGNTSQFAFTIDGPHVVEIEDLPEALAASVLSPRFLLEISAPAAAPSGERARALRVAKELAKRLRGAVYDPQAAEVVWPRSRPRVYTASGEEARIRVVQLSWYVEGGAEAHDLPAQLLQGFRAGCPEALPRRYGDYEPLQNRLDPGREDEFVHFWRTLQADELPQMLFWKGQSPCFGGSAHFPDKRARYPDGRPVGIPGTKRCTKISLSFDGRALHGDARWCSVVVQLFSTAASRLGAFYAQAHVQRNVIAKRGLWYDGQSEGLPMPFSTFAGLPPVPTWLAWFGREYACHVGEAVKAVAEQTKEGAWLFRGGPEPMDLEQLAGGFPSLPARLVFATRADAPPGEPRFVAAQFIP